MNSSDDPDSGDGDFEMASFATRSTETPQWLDNTDYALGSLYAEGGLSRIWVVRDRHLNRDVALKLIREELATNAGAISRFRREAQVTGQLEHPNIVPVYEVSSDKNPDRLFYTMRLVQGKTLRMAIDEFHADDFPAHDRRRTQLNLLQSFVDVCQAIAYANSRGVIHRDIKPENIILGNFGEVVVLDWGLAKTMKDEPSEASANPKDVSTIHDVAGPTSPTMICDNNLSQLTSTDGDEATVQSLDQPSTASHSSQYHSGDSSHLNLDEDASDFETVAGVVLGTPAYMAPEQADPGLGTIDATTDVFGLGATLYRLLTGRPPRRVKSLSKELARIATTKITPARRINSNVSKPLEAICIKALEIKQSDRYASAQALAHDIQNYIVDEPVTAWRDPLRTRIRRWISRRRTAVASAVALLMTVSIVSLISNVLLNRERQATDTAKREAESLVSEMMYNRGLLLCEQGKIDSGLLWFARCLSELPKDDATDLERVLRMSIADWQTRLNPIDKILLTDPTIVSVRQSSSKSMILIGTADGTIRLLDTRSGVQVGNTVKLSQPLQEAGFVESSNRFFSVAGDHSIQVWNADGVCVAGPFKVSEKVDVVIVHEKADRVFAGCENGQGFLWSLKTGELVTDKISHNTQILSSDFSTKGNLFCVGDASNIARLYDSESGEQVMPDLVHGGWVMSCIFSDDDKSLATTTNDHRATVWEVDDFPQTPPDNQSPPETVKPKRIFAHRADVRFVRFNRSATTLMTGSTDNAVHLWNIESGSETCPPLEHLGVPLQGYFSDDESHVITGGSDNVIRFWNASDGLSVGSTISSGSALRWFTVDPIGNNLLTLERNGRVTSWTMNLDQEHVILPHPETVYDAAFHPKTDMIVTASAGQGNSVRRWNSQHGASIDLPLNNPGFTFSLQFASDGQFLITGGTQSWLRFWDTETAVESRAGISGSSPITSVAMSDDDQFVARIGWDETLRITDLSDESLPTRSVPVPTGRVVAFQPDSQRVATAGGDGIIRVWKLPLSEASVPDLIINHGSLIQDLAFSPDGRWIAAASRDRFAWVWDSVTAEPVGSPMPHDGSVNAVAFSPDGVLLATGCDDGTARIWDLQLRLQVSAPLRHDGSVLSVTFHPGGKQIATTSNDKTARIWQVPQPLTNTPKSITQQIQRITGNRLDEFGNTRSIAEMEWRKLVIATDKSSQN